MSSKEVVTFMGCPIVWDRDMPKDKALVGPAPEEAAEAMKDMTMEERWAWVCSNYVLIRGLTDNE